MESIGASIERYLAELSVRRGSAADLQEAWSRIAGKALAQHTQPLKIVKQTLIIGVSSPTDGYMLRMQQKKICARIRDLCGIEIEAFVTKAR